MINTYDGIETVRFKVAVMKGIAVTLVIFVGITLVVAPIATALTYGILNGLAVFAVATVLDLVMVALGAVLLDDLPHGMSILADYERRRNNP